MSKEIIFITEGIGERFDEIARRSDTIYLEHPGRKVSRKPMKSYWYANCNGVVLLDHGVAGMTHYDLEDWDPEEYLPEMINEISRFADAGSLSAVVIGGDTNHFLKNKEILEGYGIPVVGEYCDGWMDDDIIGFRPPGKRAKKMDKHMVVVPETREVIMYSQPVKYLRLSPKAP